MTVALQLVIYFYLISYLFTSGLSVNDDGLFNYKT